MLLVNQAAWCCAHSHDDMDSGQHDGRAHFHISSHAHSHDHGSTGHDHEHSHQPADGFESVQAHDCHDCTAVYFGGQDQSQLAPGDSFQSKVVRHCIAVLWETKPSTVWTSPTTFEHPLCERGLYLRTCRLLI